MPSLDYKKEDIESVINLSMKGDIKALEELIKRIQKNVFNMFSYLVHKRQDVADLTQEVLLKVAKNVSTLQKSCCFNSWLNHIVMNTFYDFIKKNKKNDKIDYDEDKLLKLKDKIGCEPGEKCLFSEMDKIIKIALLSLPKDMRVVIVLREYEGLNYDDIASFTKTTIGTVKSRISRARSRLQKQLKEFL